MLGRWTRRVRGGGGGAVVVLLLALVGASCSSNDESKPGNGTGDQNFGNAPPGGSIHIPGSGGAGTGSTGTGEPGVGEPGGPVRNLCPDGQVRTTRATPRVILVLD